MIRLTGRLSNQYAFILSQTHFAWLLATRKLRVDTNDLVPGDSRYVIPSQWTAGSLLNHGCFADEDTS